MVTAEDFVAPPPLRFVKRLGGGVGMSRREREPGRSLAASERRGGFEQQLPHPAAPRRRIDEQIVQNEIRRALAEEKLGKSCVNPAADLSGRNASKITDSSRSSRLRRNARASARSGACW